MTKAKTPSPLYVKKLSSEFLEPHKLNPKDIQNYAESQKESTEELKKINALGN